MQHRIVSSHPILNGDGKLIEKGYSLKELLRYDRAAVKGGSLRIKESDRYIITNGKICLTLSVCDNFHTGVCEISFADTEARYEITKRKTRLLTMGKTGLPSTACAGDTSMSGAGYSVFFHSGADERKIYFRMEKFSGENSLSGELTLKSGAEHNHFLVCGFPDDEDAFSYTGSINSLLCEGTVRLGEDEYVLSYGNTYASYEWSRGVYPYRNFRIHSSFAGLQNGVPVSFSFEDFNADTSSADGNVVFWGDDVLKPGKIIFEPALNEIGEENISGEWKIYTESREVNLSFVPITYNCFKSNALIISEERHRMFGHLFGKISFENGDEVLLSGETGYFEKSVSKG